MSEHAPRNLAAGALLVLGLVAVGDALWLDAKAALAQTLLARAWEAGERGRRAVRPWPWADTWPVALLRAPAQGEELLVLAAATPRTLAFGPGHVAGTAAPGSAGNTVLTGHRDTHFRFLRDVAAGDELLLESAGAERTRYRVLGTEVVHVSELALDVYAPRRRLTLVTCYPFDALIPGGPWRYVVTAEVAS